MFIPASDSSRRKNPRIDDGARFHVRQGFERVVMLPAHIASADQRDTKGQTHRTVLLRLLLEGVIPTI
jgi:hypothetical protein